MTIVLLMLFALLLWLMWGEWQGFVESAWVRLGIAFGVFIAPGFALQQLLWRGADVSYSQRAVAGFGVTVGLTGALGLLATALHLAMPFVIAGLSIVLLVCAWAWAVRQGWQWHLHKRIEIRAASFWMIVPVVAACVSVAFLAARLVIEGDDLTYNAYVVHWLETVHWDWNDIFFDAQQLASPRFWLAYWTVDLALLARWADVTPLELTRVYLPPFLGVLALAATYALARGLEFSRAWSSFALTMQAAALLLLTGMNQPGLVLLNRVVEDKSVAAFILVPVFVCAVTAFLKQHTAGRLILTALIGAGLVLTHPTLMAIATAAVAIYVVLYALARREWRAAVSIGLVLMGMLLGPFAIRLLDSTYAEKIPFDDSALQRAGQLKRLLTLNETFFILNPQIVLGLPFVWMGLAGIVGAFQWKRSHAARWLAASALLLVSVIHPLFAPLWGLAISAIHLWRVIWILPFGIAAAFLATLAGKIFLRWTGLNGSEWKRRAAMALFALMCLFGALGWAWGSGNAQAVYALQTNAREQQAYADLLALRPVLAAQLHQPTIILGGTMWLNDRLPGVSANVRVPALRSALNMWLLSSVELEDARMRFQTLRRLYRSELSVPERFAFLDACQIEFIVGAGDTPWLAELVAAEPARFESVETRGHLQMYRVLPP